MLISKIIPSRLGRIIMVQPQQRFQSHDNFLQLLLTELSALFSSGSMASLVQVSDPQFRYRFMDFSYYAWTVIMYSVEVDRCGVSDSNLKQKSFLARTPLHCAGKQLHMLSLKLTKYQKVGYKIAAGFNYNVIARMVSRNLIKFRCLAIAKYPGACKDNAWVIVYFIKSAGVSAIQRGIISKSNYLLFTTFKIY